MNTVKKSFRSRLVSLARQLQQKIKPNLKNGLKNSLRNSETLKTESLQNFASLSLVSLFVVFFILLSTQILLVYTDTQKIQQKISTLQNNSRTMQLETEVLQDTIAQHSENSGPNPSLNHYAKKGSALVELIIPPLTTTSLGAEEQKRTANSSQGGEDPITFQPDTKQLPAAEQNSFFWLKNMGLVLLCFLLLFILLLFIKYSRSAQSFSP